MRSRLTSLRLEFLQEIAPFTKIMADIYASSSGTFIVRDGRAEFIPKFSPDEQSLLDQCNAAIEYITRRFEPEIRKAAGTLP